MLGNARQNVAIAERFMGWRVRWVEPKRYGKKVEWMEPRPWCQKPGAERGWFKCPNFAYMDAEIAERKAMEDGWKITYEFADGEFYVEYTHPERDEWGCSYNHNRDQASMNALCEVCGISLEEAQA